MSDEHERRPVIALAGPGIMLLSAAIFGYFGFFTTFNATSAVTGQVLIYVPMLEWTLKISAIAFLLAALLTFVRPIAGNVVYGVVGLLSAIMFLIVAGMDLADQQHTVMSPFILMLFAAWNGYGSYVGLKATFGSRGDPHAAR